MSQAFPLPRYEFRTNPPSLLDMLRHGVSDVASVIPAAILEEPAIQLPGPGAPLVVADPELARLVLNDKAEHFARDRFLRRLFRRTWGNGLAGAEGEAWQRQRRAAAPAFRPQAVAANIPAFVAAADEVVGGLKAAETVELTGLAARIVARVVFGVLVDAGGLADPDAVARDMPAYIAKVAQFSFADLLPLPESAIDRLQGIDREPAVRNVRRLAAGIAADRTGRNGKSDLVTCLEGFGPIEDNIRGLFPAALDTTVAATGWSLYLLGRFPEWQERVRAEAELVGEKLDLDALPLTRSLVQEAMRLFPPAPILLRAGASDVDLGGYRVRPGQPVVVMVYAMHRHRRHWDDPDGFDPGRFVDGGTHPAYLPFGHGPRICIAAQFALAEITAIVARLTSRFRIEPVGPPPEIALRVATRPIGGLPARFAPA